MGHALDRELILQAATCPAGLSWLQFGAMGQVLNANALSIVFRAA